MVENPELQSKINFYAYLTCTYPIYIITMAHSWRRTLAHVCLLLCLGGKVSIDIFDDTNYQLKLGMWIWNFVMQLLIFQSPMNTGAFFITFCFWGGLKTALEALVILQNVSFNNFPSYRIFVEVYGFK